MLIIFSSYSSVGNRRFRLCIENNLHAYAKAKTKHQRSVLVTSIVDAIKESQTSGRGGFVRKDPATARWYEVADKTAREKVGHALRDAIKLRKQRRDRPLLLEKRSSKEAIKRQRNQKSDGVLMKEDASFMPKSGRSYVEARKYAAGAAVTIGGRKEWECSLKESAIQFEESDNEHQMIGDESDSDDSSLTRMAQRTSIGQVSSTDGDSEQTYQESIQLMVAGGLQEPRESTPATWQPPGFSEPEFLFANYVKVRMLPGMPLTMASNFLRTGPAASDQRKRREPPLESHLIVDDAVVSPTADERVQPSSCS